MSSCLTLAAADHAVATERRRLPNLRLGPIVAGLPVGTSPARLQRPELRLIPLPPLPRRCLSIAWPRKAGMARSYPAVYGPYQSSPVVVATGAGELAADRWYRSRFGRKWLAQINAAVNRRFPDGLPGILNEVYTMRGDDARAAISVAPPARLLIAVAQDGPPSASISCPRSSTAFDKRDMTPTWTATMLGSTSPSSVDVIRMNHVTAVHREVRRGCRS